MEFATLGVVALPYTNYTLTFETLGFNASSTVSMRECVEGEYLDIDDICKVCGPGNFVDTSLGINDVKHWCKPCSAGSYNSQVGACNKTP